jgi:hypothetical protein
VFIMMLTWSPSDIHEGGTLTNTMPGILSGSCLRVLFREFLIVFSLNSVPSILHLASAEAIRFG